MKNWGYEISGEAYILRGNDFSWSVDGNISLVGNKVTSLYQDKDITGTYSIIRVGESINSILHGNIRVSMVRTETHCTRKLMERLFRVTFQPALEDL